MCIRARRCSDGVKTTFGDVFDAFDGRCAFVHEGARMVLKRRLVMFLTRLTDGVHSFIEGARMVFKRRLLMFLMRLMHDVHSCNKVLGWCSNDVL